jgi:hypothetical protein
MLSLRLIFDEGRSVLHKIHKEEIVLIVPIPHELKHDECWQCDES